MDTWKHGRIIQDHLSKWHCLWKPEICEGVTQWYVPGLVLLWCRMAAITSSIISATIGPLTCELWMTAMTKGNNDPLFFFFFGTIFDWCSLIRVDNFSLIWREKKFFWRKIFFMVKGENNLISYLFFNYTILPFQSIILRNFYKYIEKYFWNVFPEITCCPVG